MVRGDPSTLILERLPIKRTSARAPGPGPLKWSTWKPIAARLLENSNVVLHTDAAKAYQKPIAGVMHTKVVHQKKKVGSKWIKPHFTKRVSIKLPRGQTLKRVAGTQTIDGLWTTLRKETWKFQGDFHLLDEMV